MSVKVKTAPAEKKNVTNDNTINEIDNSGRNKKIKR
jgi:hypothetical protein